MVWAQAFAKNNGRLSIKAINNVFLINFNGNNLFLGLVQLTLFILLMKTISPLFWNNGEIVLAPGRRKNGTFNSKLLRETV